VPARKAEGLDDLVAQRRTSRDAVGFVGGSMHDALRTARGFVTVSSTAALEAMAMDRPTLIISDFGVSAEMINLVFEGSGFSEPR
jgi:capsule polysaccharide modification protein KpsS